MLSKKIEWLLFLFCFVFKKLRRNEEEEEKKKIGTGAVHWRERDTEKYTRRRKKQDYFLRSRAEDDRPVSVPVGSCCLELFDTDCDGCNWWISLGVRRYIPKNR